MFYTQQNYILFSFIQNMIRNIYEPDQESEGCGSSIEMVDFQPFNSLPISSCTKNNY
jgi:hypothetical protein